MRHKQLQQDERGRLGVSQGNENGCKLDEGVGIVGEANSVVPKDVAQDGEWNSAGLIINDVPLQAVDGPEIVQSESDETKVGFAGALTSHLLLSFLSNLRKEYQRIIAMQREDIRNSPL
jgi:hypothetical protein